MKNSIKALISLSVVVLLVIIVSIHRIISTPPSEATTGTPEQVADKRISDAKKVADKKIADAKMVADKIVADAKAVETQKVSDLKASELKASELKASELKSIETKKILDAKPQSAQTKELEYKNYNNKKFSYSITYPDNLKIGAETANGNVLKSDDGKVSLQLYGTNNKSDDTIDSIYNKAIKNTNMYYKVKSENWFVISYIEGDEIIYQKKVVGKASTNTFIFKFPANQKDKYTEAVDKLEKSFKTSSTDKNH